MRWELVKYYIKEIAWSSANGCHVCGVWLARVKIKLFLLVSYWLLVYWSVRRFISSSTQVLIVLSNYCHFLSVLKAEIKEKTQEWGDIFTEFFRIYLCSCKLLQWASRARLFSRENSDCRFLSHLDVNSSILFCFFKELNTWFLLPLLYNLDVSRLKPQPNKIYKLFAFK